MYIDTRDLVEKREELKQEVLDYWNEYQEERLDNEFEQDDFEDAITVIENLRDNGSFDFIAAWSDDISQIEAIDELENEVDDYSGDNFEDGVTLIEECDFEEYCEDLMKDCGYISNDLPAIIENNIDWSGISEDIRIDYTEVEYEGRTYLFR